MTGVLLYILPIIPFNKKRKRSPTRSMIRPVAVLYCDVTCCETHRHFGAICNYHNRMAPMDPDTRVESSTQTFVQVFAFWGISCALFYLLLIGNVKTLIHPCIDSISDGQWWCVMYVLLVFFCVVKINVSGIVKTQIPACNSIDLDYRGQSHCCYSCQEKLQVRNKCANYKIYIKQIPPPRLTVAWSLPADSWQTLNPVRILASTIMGLLKVAAAVVRQSDCISFHQLPAASIK